MDSPRPLDAPELDPTPLFEIFRGNYGTELLTAAVAHLGVFEALTAGPLGFEELRRALGLAERPAVVLVTALRAFGLLRADAGGRIGPTDLAREHLAPGAPFAIAGYFGLARDSPGVVEMVERLRTNRPARSAEGEAGAAFLFKEGVESAMEAPDSARRLTLALAGRAKVVAPRLAEAYPLADARILLDVAGGTGIYSIAWLRRHPDLRAIVWDRPEVLKVARELAEEYDVADRLDLVAGDMFRDPVPDGADAVLLSNVLHDWDVTDCYSLVARVAAAIRPGGRLLVHDVFLDDALDGPLPQALYSAALFCMTAGRLYSAGEVRAWLTAAGLVPAEVVPTAIHCGLLPAVKVTD